MKAALNSCLVFVAVLLTGANPADAQTFTWLPTTGGLFDNAANWSPAGGPPGAGDTTIFNSTVTQTVIFQSSLFLATHEIENGNVVFQLNQTTNTMSGSGLVVGNIVNQTGRLTILNGTLAGDMSIGDVDASTGFFTIGPNATFDSSGHITFVGNNGIGTMTINNGGRYLGTQGLVMAPNSGASGTVSVSGIGSSLATAGPIDVGQVGAGTMTISGGATASCGSVVIGLISIGSGSLTIGDEGSTLNVTGNFDVGSSGNGDLLINNGGALTTSTSRIGAFSSGTGAAKITGAGSTWTAASLAVGGSIGSNGGAGTLQITDGAAVNVTGEMQIRNTTNTAVTIDGGSLTIGGNYTNTKLGALTFVDGTLHVSGNFDNAPSNTSLTIDGATPSDLPTLQLSGASGALSHITTSVTVGSVNRGSLIIDTGRNANLGSLPLQIGATATGNGSVTVTGSASTLATTGTISVGGTAGGAAGIGALTISQNGIVSAGTLNVFPQGTLTIDDGTVSASTLSISNGATVNFLRGRINLTAGGTQALTAAILDGLLGTGHELGANRTIGGGSGTLAVQTPITINGGTLTSGSSASLTNSSTLIVNAGTVNSDAAMTNDAGRTIEVGSTGAITTPSSFTNNGTLLLNNNLVPVSGGLLTNFGVIRGSGIIANNVSNPAAGQIQATTGNRLEFSSATFNNNGIISVDGGEFVLTVGMNNNSGGLISGRNGLIRGGTTGIANTGAMAFSGGAMDVYGDVTQQTGGRITITGGGTTTFYDDVTINSGRITCK